MNLIKFLFKKGKFVKPITIYDEEKYSEGWLVLSTTILGDFIDDCFRYGVPAGIYNLRWQWRNRDAGTVHSS